MTLTDKFDMPQGSTVHEVMLRSVSEGLAGAGVVSAGDVALTAGSNSLEVDYAAGTIWYPGDSYDVSSGTLTASEGDEEDDRWDMVVFDTTEPEVTIREGTAEEYPEPPDMQSDDVLLGLLYVPSGATNVDSDNIRNWRAPADAAASSWVEDADGNFSGDTVEDALSTLASDLSSLESTVNDHSARHESGGDDELDAGGLVIDGDDNTTESHAARHESGGDDEISVTDLSGDLADAQDPKTHSGTHESGGDDEISVDDLSGDLADPQDPKTHASSHSSDGSDAVDANDLGGLPLDRANVGQNLEAVSVTSDHTTSGDELVEVDTADADAEVTVTLADADANRGQRVRVVDTGGSASQYPVTVEAETASLNDGQPAVLATDNAGATFVSDGTDWYGARTEIVRSLTQTTFTDNSLVEPGNGGQRMVSSLSLEDGETVEVWRASLVRNDGQPAESGLELRIVTFDGSGDDTLRETVLAGDGSAVFTEETGQPLASWTNGTGNQQPVGIVVYNDTSSSKLTHAGAAGRVI